MPGRLLGRVVSALGTDPNRHLSEIVARIPDLTISSGCFCFMMLFVVHPVQVGRGGQGDSIFKS